MEKKKKYFDQFFVMFSVFSEQIVGNVLCSDFLF